MDSGYRYVSFIAKTLDNMGRRNRVKEMPKAAKTRSEGGTSLLQHRKRSEKQ
jgi:hypothetical protein